MPTREEVLAQLNGEASAAPAGPSREQVLAELNGESSAPPAPEGPGMGTSAVMGAGSAASFGFNDEAGGFLGAIGEKLGLMPRPEEAAAEGMGLPAPAPRSFGEAYRDSRDQFRGIDTEAREAHPVAYHGAGLAASMANPAFAAGKGAGVLARIGTATGQGALAGAGNSTAEVTEGDFSGAAKDALIGGAVGGAIGTVAEGAGAGIRKIVGGAPQRQAIRTADALLEKTPAKTVQDRALGVLEGKEGLSRVLKSEGLEKYARKASQGLDLAEEKLADVGGDIGSIYAKADEAMPQGVAMRSEVYDRLNSLLDGYAEKDQVAKFAALKGMVTKLKGMDEHIAGPEAAAAASSAGTALPDRPMSAQAIFELKKQLNNIGFNGVASDIPKQDGHQAARDAGEIIRDFLAERVDKSTGQADRLDKLNEKWRDLNEVRRVFQAKAERDARNSPSMGQHVRGLATTVSGAVGVPAGLAAIASGHPVYGAMLAAPGLAAAAPYAARGMDGLLSMLGEAAKRGGAAPAELIRRAVNTGIPEETAASVVRSAQGGGQQGSGFDQWYAGMAAQKGLDPNPDAPEHHYDYRSYYRDAGGTPDGHFPSQYKTAGHPREYLTDSNGRIFDTKTGTYVEDGSAVQPGELDRAEYAPELRQRIVR